MSPAWRKQLALTGLLLAAAVLCTFSAGNRLAEIPGHAESRLSPSWFGAGNTLQHAVRSVDQKDFASALSWSSIAVARDPIGQHSTSLLGLSLLGTGQAQAAQRAYTVAAATGWRDVGVQTYWMLAALAVGDEDVAAQRLDALLRTGNRDQQTLDGLATLESTSSGRKALVERLRLGPDWERWYVLSLGTLHGDDLTRRMAVIAGAFHRGLRLDRDDIAKAGAAMRQNGEVKAAAWLWSHLGGQRSTGLKIADGSFDGVDKGEASGPFDWTLLETGGVDVRVDHDGPLHSGAALYGQSLATTTRRIAQQALILPPGTYELHWRSAGDDGARSADIGVRLLCSDTGVKAQRPPVIPVGQNGSKAVFTVPAEGCESQLVAIELQPNTTLSRSPSWIDDVSIARVTAAD